MEQGQLIRNSAADLPGHPLRTHHRTIECFDAVNELRDALAIPVGVEGDDIGMPKRAAIDLGLLREDIALGKWLCPDGHRKRGIRGCGAGHGKTALHQGQGVRFDCGVEV